MQWTLKVSFIRRFRCIELVESTLKNISSSPDLKGIRGEDGGGGGGGGGHIILCRLCTRQFFPTECSCSVQMLPLIQNSARTLVDIMKEKADSGKSFDIARYISFGIDITFDILLGFIALSPWRPSLPLRWVGLLKSREGSRILWLQLRILCLNLHGRIDAGFHVSLVSLCLIEMVLR